MREILENSTLTVSHTFLPKTSLRADIIPQKDKQTKEINSENVLKDRKKLIFQIGV
jgi:hypothetical protein